MLRARSLSSWALAAAPLLACGPPNQIVPWALAPEDAVVLILGEGDLTSARAEVVAADARGLARAETEERLLAALHLRGADFIDTRGDPRSLDGLSADLDGDRDDGCGCRAFSLDRTQVVAPGDRCPPPPSVEPYVTGAVDAAHLRERLRLRWPGECECPKRPFAASARVEACALGEEAERMEPLRTVVGRDGTVTLVSRSLVVEIAPDGTRYETRVEPPFGDALRALALPEGGALFISRTYRSGARMIFSHLPRRGSGPVELVEPIADELEALDAVPMADGGGFWLYGERQAASGWVIKRCRFTGTSAIARCEPVLPAPAAECPQNAGIGAIFAATELEGGDLAFAGDGGLSFVRDGELVCVPGTGDQRWLNPRGEELAQLRIQGLVAAGRHLLMCGTGIRSGQGRTLVSAAMVGDLSSPLQWRPLHEDGLGICHPLRFQDPADPEHALLRTVFVDFVASRSSTVVEQRSPDLPYFSELPERVEQAASASTAFAVTTVFGETWVRRPGETRLQEISAFKRRLVDRSARAILPVEGGFRVYTGGRAPMNVRTGASCEALRLDAAPSAFEPDPNHYDRAVTRLGDRTLLFGQRGEQLRMAILDADDALVSEVPLDIDVRRAVELVPGRWAALLDEDGGLFATDGRRILPLDTELRWVALDANRGVGWAATETELARLTAGPNGEPALERDVLARVDTAEFRALERNVDPAFEQVRALCDGSVIVVVQESLQRTLAAAVDGMSAWIVETIDGRPTMSRYAIGEPGGRPLGSQRAVFAGGPEDAPLLLFSKTISGDGAHVQGAGPVALPFNDSSALVGHGSEMLVGARFLRLHYLRVDR